MSHLKLSSFIFSSQHFCIPLRHSIFLIPCLIFAFALLLLSCSKPNQQAGLSIKEQQYYVHGEQLYTQHCSNCHQKNGTGLGLVYPPLDTSDYMDHNFDAVICLMKNGVKGELIVNGKSFNKSMPGIPTLTDLEITEIATYIYNTWSHQRDSIDAQSIARILDQCEQK